MSRENETKQALASHRWITALLCLWLVGCGGVDEMRWKEEVWLNDGRRIEIDRYATAVRNGFPNSRRGPTLTEDIYYAPRGIIWKGKNEQPVSFEIIGDSVYLVTLPGYSREKFCPGKPHGTFLAKFYRWKNGEMEVIEQEQAPLNNLGNNLSGDSHWGRGRSSDPLYISWRNIAWITSQPERGPPRSVEELFWKIATLHCP